MGKAPLDRGAPAKRVRGRPAQTRKNTPCSNGSQRQNQNLRPQAATFPKSEIPSPKSVLPRHPRFKSFFPPQFPFHPQSSPPPYKKSAAAGRHLPDNPDNPREPRHPRFKSLFSPYSFLFIPKQPTPHIKKLRPQAASFPHPASRTPHPVFFKSPRKKAPQRGAAFTYHLPFLPKSTHFSLDNRSAFSQIYT